MCSAFKLDENELEEWQGGCYMPEDEEERNIGLIEKQKTLWK